MRPIVGATDIRLVDLHDAGERRLAEHRSHERRRWHQCHAVSSCTPSCRESSIADNPRFDVTHNVIARNHSRSGLRVWWNSVPAVTDSWCPQLPHSSTRGLTGHDFLPSHFEHTKPSGHLCFLTNARRHASSVPNRSSKSTNVVGNFSMFMHPFYTGGLTFPGLPMVVA